MRKIIIIAFVIISQMLFSQTYTINNGGNVNACSGTFTIGSHNAGDVFTMTLCDDDPDSTHVSVAYDTWSFGGGDVLNVYDGTDNTYPLLGSFDQSNFQTPWAMTASPSNMTGCLTFEFVSNGGGSTFSGEIHCLFNCQYFDAVIDSTSEQTDTLYTDICQGETVTFYGSGDYMYNGGLYNQSNAQCTFTWDFGDGTPVQTGQVVTHTFPTGGGYMIDLKLTDQYGCLNRNDIDHRVRVSMTPTWTTGTDTICPGETVTIGGSAGVGSATAHPPFWDNTPNTVVAGQTYLPDGNGASYQTDLLFDMFGNQTLDSIEMLEGICVNMEHSFIGDLVMQITCPDGTTVTLENQAGGGVYLGEPLDYDPSPPGVGWDYCWGPNPTYGEMGVEASNGTIVTNNSLPSGTYTSAQPLTGLLGCPLNGVWTFTVTDNWSIDDGYIFSWGINFAPWVFPDYWYFQNNIVSYQWDGENIISYQDSVVTVAPLTEGQVCYDVTVTDDFGCEYSDQTCIEVLAATDPTCYCETPPTTINFAQPLCAGDNVTFTYSGAADISNSSFDWNFNGGTVISGDVTGPGPIEVSFSNYGTSYTIALNVTEGICIPADTTYTVNIPSQMNILIAGTNNLCFGDTSGTIDVTVSGGTLPYSYNWTPAQGNIEDLTSLSSGTYSIVVNDANSCSVTASYTVTGPPLLTITNEETTDILCNGDANGTVKVEVNGGTPTYNFDYGSGSNTTGYFTGLNGGTYTVTITDQNNCTVISNPLVIYEPPKLTFTSKIVNDILCHGEANGSIVATVTGGVGNYSYILNGSSQSTGSFTNLEEGYYNLIVTDANGCMISFDTTIIEPSKLISSIPEEIIICQGEIATIQSSVTGGTTPYAYHWGHTGLNVDVVNESPSDDEIYSLYVTDNNNCISPTTHCEVLVSPDVFLNAYSNIDSICPGDPVLMTAEPSGGNNQYTIILENDTVSANSVLYPNLTYDYTFTVIDGCGETASAIVPIFVYPIPPASFYPDIMEGCQPLQISFIETSPDSGQAYLWNFGDEDPSNIGSDKYPVHIYQNAGDFDVTLTVTSADGCLNTLEIFNLIHVYPKPEAKFIADPDVVSIIEPEVYFNNQSIGGDSYSWDFGDSDTSSVENPTHIYPTNAITDYIVTLIVTTNRGCVDTVKKTLKVREEYTFYAPSAFSPDGDGINDFFICKGNGIDLDNYYLAIYDRWGEIIWETNDLFEGWNGIAKDHKKVQNGLYKWHVIYKNSDGVEYKKTGNVTVIY